MITLILPIQTSLAQSRTRKFKRGTINLLTGWVEIPKNIYDVTVESSLARGLTMGLSGGIGKSIVRTGSGVYEIVTFPFPCPENYRVILEPEFVVTRDN